MAHQLTDHFFGQSAGNKKTDKLCAEGNVAVILQNKHLHSLTEWRYFMASFGAVVSTVATASIYFTVAPSTESL